MTKPIQARALHHLREAQAFGWHQRRLMVDYACAALEAEGYDETNAAAAVEAVWTQRFAIHGPV